MPDSVRLDFNDAATKEQWEKLESAARSGDMAVLRTLKSGNPFLAASGRYSKSLLGYAASRGKMDAVRHLLTLGATLGTDDGGSLLEEVLRDEKDDIAEVLLLAGIVPVRPGASHVKLLAAAAENGCIKAARWLLAAGVDPNADDRYDDPPLVKAARYSRVEIIALLLEHQADPNKANKISRSAMHYAARYGKPNIVTMLHKKGAQVNASASDGATPLSEAVERGDEPTVKLLLELGAKPDGSGGDHVPLLQAAKDGRAAIVSMLLARGADPNGGPSRSRKEIPLIEAAGSDSDRVVNLLLDAGADVNAQAGSLKRNALGAAAYSSSVSAATLRRMLAMGAEVDGVDYYGRTPLLRACEYKRKEKINALIDAGANVNTVDQNGYTPLYYAVEHSDADLVRLLLQRGADANCGGPSRNQETPFYKACEEGNYEIAQMLLAHKADVNAPGGLGKRTALNAAARGGHARIVQMLITAGADLEARDYNGNTALHGAIEYRKPSVAAILMDAGASVTCVNGKGESLLTTAASGRDVDSVRRLLKAGLSPDMADKDGRLPLVAAAEKGDVERLRILLAAGATLDLQDSNGYTALIAACHGPQREAVSVLLAAGADLDLCDHSKRKAYDLVSRYSSEKDVADLLAQEAERRKTEALKKEDPAERIRLRVAELEKRLSQGDDSARAVASGDPARLRAVVDAHFWEQQTRRPSWELTLFALLTENRQMLRLLSAWQAECGTEHLEELRLLAGDKYSDYARLLRQTGFSVSVVDLALKPEKELALVYSKEEAALGRTRVALVREAEGKAKTVLYTSIVESGAGAAGCAWFGKASAFRDLCRRATVEDLKTFVANDAKPAAKPRIARPLGPRP